MLPKVGFFNNKQWQTFPSYSYTARYSAAIPSVALTPDTRVKEFVHYKIYMDTEEMAGKAGKVYNQQQSTFINSRAKTLKAGRENLQDKI